MTPAEQPKQEMKGIIVGYTGWFNWPPVYCQILEINSDMLRVELDQGGEGWVKASDFTPRYMVGAVQKKIHAGSVA
jgi:hypothetical protein